MNALAWYQKVLVGFLHAPPSPPQYPRYIIGVYITAASNTLFLGGLVSIIRKAQAHISKLLNEIIHPLFPVYLISSFLISFPRD